MFLHEDGDDAAFWTSSIPPSILWTSPALRAYSMMLDTFAVSEHSLICKGPEAPVFACRIRSFQERCDCVAHCHEWLVSNEERYVKHDARFDCLHSLAAPYAALLLISIFFKGKLTEVEYCDDGANSRFEMKLAGWISPFAKTVLDGPSCSGSHEPRLSR